MSELCEKFGVFDGKLQLIALPTFLIDDTRCWVGKTFCLSLLRSRLPYQCLDL